MAKRRPLAKKRISSRTYKNSKKFDTPEELRKKNRRRQKRLNLELFRFHKIQDNIITPLSVSLKDVIKNESNLKIDEIIKEEENILENGPKTITNYLIENDCAIKLSIRDFNLANRKEQCKILEDLLKMFPCCSECTVRKIDYGTHQSHPIYKENKEYKYWVIEVDFNQTSYYFSFENNLWTAQIFELRYLANILAVFQEKYNSEFIPLLIKNSYQDENTIENQEQITLAFYNSVLLEANNSFKSIFQFEIREPNDYIGKNERQNYCKRVFSILKKVRFKELTLHIFSEMANHLELKRLDYILHIIPDFCYILWIENNGIGFNYTKTLKNLERISLGKFRVEDIIQKNNETFIELNFKLNGRVTTMKLKNKDFDFNFLKQLMELQEKFNIGGKFFLIYSDITDEGLEIIFLENEEHENLNLNQVFLPRSLR